MILRLLLIAFLLWLIYILIRRTGNILMGDFTKAKPRKKQVKKDDIYDHISPRDAAVAMMIAVARTKGVISPEARQAIFSIMDETFDCQGHQAESLFEAASQLCSEVSGSAHLINCLSPTINRNCSYIEKKQLYSMLYLVSTADKEDPDKRQVELLELVSEYLDIGRQFVNVPPNRL